MVDHRLDRMTAFAAGIGISRPLGAIGKGNSGGHQLKMSVIPVLCVC